MAQSKALRSALSRSGFKAAATNSAAHLKRFSNLAGQGVVLVSLNCRLGVFWFPGLTELDEERSHPTIATLGTAYDSCAAAGEKEYCRLARICSPIRPGLSHFRRYITSILAVRHMMPLTSMYLEKDLR